MVVLVGESASGKSSIEKELVRSYGFEKVISYTTRSPRAGEVDGVDYHFISEETFNDMYMKNQFCETGKYRGWNYGTAKKDVLNGGCQNKVIVVTPHGLRQLIKHKELNITSFYIKVSRRDRLIKILQRGDDIEEAYRRSLSDVGQFDGVEDEVDYVIDNNGYVDSVHDLTYFMYRNCVDR